jgi:hypothetical protein
MIRALPYSVVRGARRSLAKMLGTQMLFDFAHDIVTDKPLRFFALKDFAASFYADFGHAMDVILQNAHDVAQCLFIRLTLRLIDHRLHFLFEFFALFRINAARNLFHLFAVLFGFAAVPILCAASPCQ